VGTQSSPRAVTKRRTGRLSGRHLLIVFVAAFLSQGNGCMSMMAPSTLSGPEQCASIAALYCNSYSVPQTLENAPGTCCAVGDRPNASVGYLCAFGADRNPAGCVSSLGFARELCPHAPSIVQCVR
jgi:hypothetical protein